MTFDHAARTPEYLPRSRWKYPGGPGDLVMQPRAFVGARHEITAIPELLSKLAIEGCVVTIDEFRADLLGVMT